MNILKIRIGSLHWKCSLFSLAVFIPLQATNTCAKEVALLPLVQSHFDTYLEFGLDRYGPLHTPLWMASLDTKTKNYPSSDYAAAGNRMYRENPAPKGSTLYHDIPQIEAALRLTDETGSSKYADAAASYVTTYLQESNGRDVSRIPDSGLWKWGAHWYYRAFDGSNDPINNFYNDRYRGFFDGHHELRPHMPNWDYFYALLPDSTIEQVDKVGEFHVKGGYNTSTGEFSRHDQYGNPPDMSTAYSFLNSGGVLVESMAWLAEKTSQGATAPHTTQDYLDQAKAIARYSHNARSTVTGLIRNNLPAPDRWDYHVSTSEIGDWANSLLRVAERTNDLEYLEMARDGVNPWLMYAWDPTTERYYGKVRVTTGTPSFDRSVEFAPLDYSSPWNVELPSHDHFLEMASALISLHQWNSIHHPEDLPMLEMNIRRQATNIMEERPALNARKGMGAYAVAYGRAIDFMLRAGELLDDESFRDNAERLGHEAVTVLYTGDMFRSHGGEERYDAIDGFGYLSNALLDLGSYHAPSNVSKIASYQFTDTPAPVSWLDSTDVDPKSHASPFHIGNGLTVVKGSGQNQFTAAVDFATAHQPNQNTAMIAADYVSFSVEPASDHFLDMSHLTFDLLRSGGNANRTTRYFVRSSVDGFEKNLAADEISRDRPTLNLISESHFISLIGSEYQHLTEPVEFRIYFYDVGGSSSGFVFVDNVELYGAVAAVPELASASLLAVGATCLCLLRRNR